MPKARITSFHPACPLEGPDLHDLPPDRRTEIQINGAKMSGHRHRVLLPWQLQHGRGERSSRNNNRDNV